MNSGDQQESRGDCCAAAANRQPFALACKQDAPWGKPPSTEQMQLGLSLQTALGTALMAMRGYAAPKVVQAFARGRELCRALSDTPSVIPVLSGLCLFYMQGDFEGTRRHFEQCIALYAPSRDRDLLRQQGQDPAVISLLMLAWTLRLQGYSKRAVPRWKRP